MATEIIETIGTSGEDYTDWNTWEAALPANLVSADEQYSLEVSNAGEITQTSTCAISGHTTDATRFIEIRPKSGEGFADGIGSSPLRYDSSYGAATRSTSGTNYTFELGDDYTVFREMQLRHESYVALYITGDNCLVDRCIIYGEQGPSYTGAITMNNASKIVNSLIVSTGGNDFCTIELGFSGSGGGEVIACTALTPSDVTDSDFGIAEYGGTNYVMGSASFGHTNCFDTNGSWGSGSDYNASDDTTGPGANTLDSQTYADQFEATAIATLDARLKVTSDLIGQSIQYAETNDVDILGNPRDTSTPDIGCFEYQGAILGSGTPQADTATLAGSGAASGGSTFDLKVQHISDDIGNTGGTNTGFTAVGSLTSAIELANNNRMTHAGNADLTSTNLEGDDLAGGRVLTGTGTLTYYRESASVAADMRFETSLLEYVGPSAGSNEFIVRGRYAVDLNGTTNSTTVDITSAGISTAADCIPFITGIMNDATVDDADSATALAYLESSTTLRVQKGSNDNNVKVYITLVEFTGSNWTVLHGDSGSVSGDTGTITLRDGSDGTGTATDVSSWAEAVIFGQHIGDTGASGTNDAIADNWPLFEDGANDQSVDWTFNVNHDSAGTNRQFVHVLNHADMAVTRYSLANNAAGETTVNITSASLSSLDQAIVVGSSISSGTGTAYGRGWRNYYFNSTTEAAFWCHRSGNTMAHRMQIVDFSGLVTSGGSSTTGSGTPQAGTASLNGSGVNNNSGSGTLQAFVATMSASGVGSNAASGSPQAEVANMSGSGDVDISSSGSPQASNANASGSGTVDVDGSGSPQAEVATIVGSGNIAIDGSGSPQAENSSSTGSGEVNNVASGSPQAENSAIDGSGTVVQNVDGSGSPQADNANASGSGLAITNIDASGSPQADQPTSSGSGIISNDGSGTLISGISTIDGSGIISINASGSPQAELGTIISSGTVVGPILGNGTIVAAISNIAGSGTVIPPITGVGTLVSSNCSINSSGEVSLAGSGSPQSGNATIDGHGVSSVVANGSLQAGNSVFVGSGTTTVNIFATGSLLAGAVQLSSVGSVSIVGYGTLVPNNSTITGYGLLVVGMTPITRIGYVPEGSRTAFAEYNSRTAYVKAGIRTAYVKAGIRTAYVPEDDRIAYKQP